MKFIGAIIIFALFLLGAFLLANWDVISAPTQLSFLFFEAKGSVGLISLGIALVFAILFIGYSFTLRTRMLMEGRRYDHEIGVQRKLADSAETSRFDQLREQITLEFANLHKAKQDTRSSLIARTEELEKSLQKSLDETINSLLASMGEMEEKLDRVLARIAV